MVDDANLTRLQYTVIGTMLQTPACVGEVLTQLGPDDFRSEAARGLFEAIGRLHAAGAPVDPVMVQREAGEEYAVAIDEMRKWTTSGIEHYCAALRENSRLYEAQTVAMGIATAESLREIEPQLDRLNGLMSARRGVRIVSMTDAFADFCRRMESGPPKYLKWGIRELDEALYIEQGDFVVIGGYSSAGKTLLALQFAAGMSEKYRVGFFSHETNVEKLTDRIMAHAARVPLRNVKNHSLSEEDWRSVSKLGAQRVAKMDIEFLECSGMSVRDIRAHALSRRFDVIFIDYLQIIESAGHSQYEKVTAISKELHTLAQSQKITVIALAQLSRAEKTRDEKPIPPSMSSFRESGQIEQDADAAMILYPENMKDNDSKRILKVVKNKEGRKLSVSLDFDGAHQTFTVARPSVGEQIRAAKAATRRPLNPQIGLDEMVELPPHAYTPF